MHLYRRPILKSRCGAFGGLRGAYSNVDIAYEREEERLFTRTGTNRRPDIVPSTPFYSGSPSPVSTAAMPPLVDIHTHVYPPSYISLLASRTTVPYIHHPEPTSSSPTPPPRLIILPSDDDPSIPLAQRGRPVDSSYSSVTKKLAFMSQHRISTSVISLANPWLDFLPSNTALSTAQSINNDMAALCAAHPGKLFAFGTLPLSAPTEDIIVEIKRLASIPEIKGLILGTSGLGKGLDDARMEPLWAAIQEHRLLIFLHPHYGLPSEVFGPVQHDSGHVLPLALGFPMETTIAFTRMYLAGVFDRHRELKVLLAHAGGTVPFLAGRLESCVLHERAFLDEHGRLKERRGIWEVLKKNIWLDGVVYSAAGIKAAVNVVGKERVVWGTDHPFFPPITGGEDGGDWESVKTNVEAVREAFQKDEEGAQGVLARNAIELLGLDTKA